MPATEVRIFKARNGVVEFQHWLDRLELDQPKAYGKCIVRILQLSDQGNQMRRPAADYLRDGVYELRATYGDNQFRILYFFYGKNAVALSHATDKQAEVPPREIDKAVARIKLVKSDPERYTAEIEL